jgi:hypothetical protein
MDSRSNTLEQPIFHLALLRERSGADSHNELRRLSGLLALAVAVLASG